MKKIIFVLITLSSFIISAQNYPYKRPELLLGKEVKVRPIPSYSFDKGYKYFYTDSDTFSTYAKLNAGLSKKEALENRVFKITNVTAVTGRYGKYHVLTLESNGEKLYYEYDFEDSPTEYYFEIIGGLNYPEDFYCDYVYESIAADGYKKFKINESYAFIHIIKEIDLKTGKESYMAHLNLGSDAVSDKAVGAAIYFENDKVIDRPKQLIGRLKHNDTAYIELSEKDVELFKNYKVTGIKLINHEMPLNNGERMEELKGAFNCLITKK